MKKILIVGDSCTDIFVYGEVSRVCPEAPCVIFNPEKETQNGGMALNVLNNIMSLGEIEVDIETNKEEIKKIRYVDEKSNQMLMRLDINDSVSNSFNPHSINYSKYDAVIVSDYNKGFLTENNIYHISKSHDLTFLDTKRPLGGWAANYTFIKVNEPEWEMSKKHGNQYAKWRENLIITKGRDGCCYKSKNYPAETVSDIKDVSGAGDSFMAGLVYDYLLNSDIESAIRFANQCAGMVVKKRGVVTIKDAA